MELSVSVHAASAALADADLLHLSYPWQVPVWDITHKLSELSLDLDGIECVRFANEQTEASMALYQIPTAPATNEEEFSKQRDSVASRAIVAAARGGQLRCLALNEDVQGPFAVRHLLPYWVRVKFSFFGPLAFCANNHALGAWLVAAMQLPQLLSHAARWISKTGEIRLSSQDVQAFKAYCDRNGVPDVIWDGDMYSEAVETYLLWLQEDADLATEVANEWNSLVEREGARKFRCQCDNCAAEWSDAEDGQVDASAGGGEGDDFEL